MPTAIGRSFYGKIWPEWPHGYWTRAVWGIPVISGFEGIWPQICYVQGRTNYAPGWRLTHQSQSHERPGKARPSEEVTWLRNLKVLFLPNGDFSSRS